MSKLQWDVVGTREYETGVNQVALYTQKPDGAYNEGVSWSGVTAITESPSGADSNPLYADNIKYLDLTSAEEFGATIEAYSYPDEFMDCDGTKQVVPGVMVTQQNRTPFGLAFKTILGNDTENDQHGYKIHLIYNAKAAVSESAYTTVSDSPEAITFSWELTTTPVEITGTTLKPTSRIIINSTDFTSPELKTKLKTFEDTLWGKDAGDDPDTEPGIEPTLPSPAEVIDMLTA